MDDQEKEIRSIIKKNIKSSDDKTIYEYGDWHSVDGEFFQKINLDGSIVEIGSNGHKETIKPD
jgi:hypothetical protein